MLIEFFIVIEYEGQMENSPRQTCDNPFTHSIAFIVAYEARQVQMFKSLGEILHASAKLNKHWTWKDHNNSKKASRWKKVSDAERTQSLATSLNGFLVYWLPRHRIRVQWNRNQSFHYFACQSMSFNDDLSFHVSIDDVSETFQLASVLWRRKLFNWNF